MDKDKVLGELERVSREMEACREERDRLIVQALSLGASAMLVGKITGVSARTVARIKNQYTM